MKIINSNIVTAYGRDTIGAKIVDCSAFDGLLGNIVKLHMGDKDQAVLTMFGPADGHAPEVRRIVLPGIRKRTTNPDDYVCRSYRGQVQMFMRRDPEPQNVSWLRAVVYTVTGYLMDPDVKNDKQESDRIYDSDASHVLVAVLASPAWETQGEVSPYRFVCNLAGGNLEYCPDSNIYIGIDRIIDLAKKVKEYDEQWCVVAD